MNIFNSERNNVPICKNKNNDKSLCVSLLSLSSRFMTYAPSAILANLSPEKHH